MNPELLSVVVAIVDGGAALRRCLAALVSQESPPSIELLVPYDSNARSVAALAVEFPAARFLDLGYIQTRRAPSSASGQHELIDRRRAAGLAAARGELIAMVEDRAVPRPDWAATVVRLHEAMSHAVIGGAVENGRDRLLNWAVYFCDFGRYQLPFAAGPGGFVTDVNVTYKRRALEQTRNIWQGRYHEPLVHWAVKRSGDTLFVSPDLIVDEIRDDLRLPRLVVERFAWGRLFGELRVRKASVVHRFALAAMSPLVPAVLFARFLRQRNSKGTSLWRVARVAPVVVLLSCVWAAGEATGYVTGTS